MRPDAGDLTASVNPSIPHHQPSKGWISAASPGIVGTSLYSPVFTMDAEKVKDEVSIENTLWGLRRSLRYATHHDEFFAIEDRGPGDDLHTVPLLAEEMANLVHPGQ
jgi:hypothetical protein